MVMRISSLWLERGLRAAAVVLVMGLVAGLLVGGAQPVAVGLVPAPWDKLAHGAVFAMLAGAVGFASGLRGWRMLAVACVGAVSVGVVDEWHQLFLPGRAAGLDDVAADAVGAAFGAAALLQRERLAHWLRSRVMRC